MAPTLTSHTSGGVAMAATPQTLALPATTNASDCIIVGVGCTAAVNSNLLTMSAGGATWLGPYVCTTGCGYFVGYNCSAGNTTATLTHGSSGAGEIIIGIFSGVATTSPVLSVASVSSAVGAAAVSGTITYVAGDLLIGGSESFSAFVGASGSWSNGSTTHLVDKTTGSHNPFCEYTVPASGTSTTYTSPTPNASQNVNLLSFVLAPAPSTTVIYPVHPLIVPQAVNRSTVF